MKKFLSSLFLAAMLTSATSASAEVLFTYDFNDQSTWSKFSYIGGNSGQSYTSYSEDSFDASTGMVAIVGGAYVNASASWISGTTLANLGDEIGQVLCLSGSSSIINGILKDSFGEGLDSITNACSQHWANIIFYLSGALTPESSTDYSGSETDASKLVKVSVVLNVWDAQSSTAAISAIYAANSNDNIVPNSVESTQASVNVSDFYTDGVYDPTKWMTYEFYGWSAAQLSARLKIANGRGTDWTIFIKSVTFETVDEVPDSYGATTSITSLDEWNLSYTNASGESVSTTLVDNNYGYKIAVVAVSDITSETAFSLKKGFTQFYSESSVVYTSEASGEYNDYALSTTESGTISLSAVPEDGYLVFGVTDGEDGGYTLRVVSSDGENTVGITTLAAEDRSIVSERYYNLAGVEVAEPVDGSRNLYIVVRGYDDGTSDAVKVVR